MGPEGDITGEQLAQVSREIVRLKSQSYGKGATEAKTYLNDNFLFCVLKDGLTQVERTLLDHGDHAMVRDYRLRYQDRMAESYRSVVRTATGRQVLTYHSQLLFDPHYTIEIFVLGPAGGDVEAPSDEELDDIVQDQ